MLRKYQFEEEKSLQFNIPWDKHTAIGFVISVIITSFLIFLLTLMTPDIPDLPNIRNKSIPLTILNFGDGDGTGLSSGNLTKEGKTHKGKEPNSQLEDAKTASKTKQSRESVSHDTEEATDFKPVEELSTETNTQDEGGSDAYNVGDPDGLTDASGLGSRGSGKGAGLGFGDIDWGGGGNRTVLYKTLPKFPDGVKTSAKIKLRFTVNPDGTVGRIFPLQKADPKLEEAAMEALRKWRFNSINEDLVMVGTIPLTFRLK